MSYPFSENVQRGILYLLKTDTNFYTEIVSLVKAKYFEYPAHQHIFTCIKDYYEKYKHLPTDDNLVECLRLVIKDSEDISDYIEEIEDIGCIEEISKSKEFYLDQVELFARVESMKEALAESIIDLQKGKIGNIQEKILQASQITRTVDLGQDYFETVTERWLRSLKTNNEELLPTLFPCINDSLKGGIAKKELAMVAAPPGGCKSVYLANQAVKTLTCKNKVALVSLEMSEDRYANRIDSIMTLIPNCKLGSEQTKLKDRMGVFKDTFEGCELIIKEFPTAVTNVNHIRAWLNKLRIERDFVPDLLIVDYLELLEPIREGLPDYKGQERIAQELRGLGQELNMAVWTATQCNREGSKAKVITENEFADSFGKIRVADLAISLNQSLEEFDNGRMRGFVIKNRNGKAKFIFPINIDYSMLVMREGNFERQENNDE